MRTKANAIRQQMLQNSQNWHTAGTQAERDNLHQQNLELNRILSQYAGGVESRYDPATGRWTTENADLGYGDIDPYDRANAKRLKKRLNLWICLCEPFPHTCCIAIWKRTR